MGLKSRKNRSLKIPIKIDSILENLLYIPSNWNTNPRKNT